MRRRRKDQNGEYNYWQPATDMMTGLVFVLMLIVALLGLYLLSDYTGYKYDETEGVEETTAQETVRMMTAGAGRNIKATAIMRM